MYVVMVLHVQNIWKYTKFHIFYMRLIVILVTYRLFYTLK